MISNCTQCYVTASVIEVSFLCLFHSHALANVFFTRIYILLFQCPCHSFYCHMCVYNVQTFRKCHARDEQALYIKNIIKLAGESYKVQLSSMYLRVSRTKSNSKAVHIWPIFTSD